LPGVYCVGGQVALAAVMMMVVVILLPWKRITRHCTYYYYNQPRHCRFHCTGRCRELEREKADQECYDHLKREEDGVRRKRKLRREKKDFDWTSVVEYYYYYYDYYWIITTVLIQHCTSTLHAGRTWSTIRYHGVAMEAASMGTGVTTLYFYTTAADFFSPPTVAEESEGK